MVVSLSVFEGIEKAARRLKQDVLGGLSARSLSTEQQLRQAARAVAERTGQVDQQLQQRIRAVEDRLLRAVTERCEALIGPGRCGRRRTRSGRCWPRSSRAWRATRRLCSRRKRQRGRVWSRWT